MAVPVVAPRFEQNRVDVQNPGNLVNLERPGFNWASSGGSEIGSNFIPPQSTAVLCALVSSMELVPLLFQSYMFLFG